MRQKYQNACVFIGLSILLMLLPLLLTAQSSISLQKMTTTVIDQRIERATLYELLSVNPNNTFSTDWNSLDRNENFDVCQLKEVTCNTENQITILDLSNKSLELLPASIHNLTHLERLHLHENRIKHLPATLGNMTNLLEFTFHTNKLNELPSALRNLCGITVRQGLMGNPVAQRMSWEDFCRGI